jgi:hypothetical protein
MGVTFSLSTILRGKIVKSKISLISEVKLAIRVDFTRCNSKLKTLGS